MSDIEDVDMAIESAVECIEVLTEFKNKLLLKQGLLAEMMKANQMHIEATDNECIGHMQ